MRRLSVVGLAGAALAATASPASAANDVWLWTCHGPAGQGLHAGPLFDDDGDLAPPFAGGASGDAGLAAFGAACASSEAGGLSGRFARAGEAVTDPAAGSNAEVVVYVPPDLSLADVTLTRATHGITGERQPGNPQRYVAATGGGTLESAGLADPTPADLSGSKTFPVTSAAGGGDSVRLRIRCELLSGQCPASPAGPVSFDVSRVGLHVTDARDPAAALNWHSPVTGDLALHVDATDVGSGLWSAQALVDGATMATTSFGGATCQDLTPDDAVVDLPIDADCPHVKGADLTVKTIGLTDGDHALVVRVLDAAGRVWQRKETLSVANHIDLGQPSQTLTIGTTVPGSQQSPGSGGGSSGGVLGASATSCRSPKLSMLLNQKPLRVSHGVPVLLRNKTYRFKGRLTCSVRGRRVSGPKHARVDLINVVGAKTVEKNGTTVRAAGRITMILKYRSSRTLIFRFVNSDGKRVQVRIKIKIARK